MDRAVAEKIVEAVNENGGEARLYEEYSGRGMYGKTTTGVVIIDGDIVSSVISNADLFVDVDEDSGYCNPKFDMRRMRYDQLGLNEIYY